MFEGTILIKTHSYFVPQLLADGTPLSTNNVNISAELPRGPVGQILCLEKEVVVLPRNRLLLSPLLGCFFSWGFPDNSCAFGNYSTEKVYMSVCGVMMLIQLCKVK